MKTHEIKTELEKMAKVSLKNNGGFASMRSPARFETETQVLELTTRGDGKR